jgi:hypothetical protein
MRALFFSLILIIIFSQICFFNEFSYIYLSIDNIKSVIYIVTEKIYYIKEYNKDSALDIIIEEQLIYLYIKELFLNDPTLGLIIEEQLTNYNIKDPTLGLIIEEQLTIRGLIIEEQLTTTSIIEVLIKEEPYIDNYIEYYIEPIIEEQLTSFDIVKKKEPYIDPYYIETPQQESLRIRTNRHFILF